MSGRTPTAGDLTRHRGTCRSCPQPVLWATTAKGERMPVNPDPSPAGDLVLEIQAGKDGELLVAHVLRRTQIPGARAAGQTLRTSHFTDCPRAAHHRKARR